jgi:hypothetical protein
MKYAVELGSGVTICLPRFIKTGSGIRKLIERLINRRLGSLISLPIIFFSKNKKRELKKGLCKDTAPLHLRLTLTALP